MVRSKVHALWCWVNCDLLFEQYLLGLSYSKVEKYILKNQGSKVSLNKMFTLFTGGYNPKIDPLWLELVQEFQNLKVSNI